MSTEREPRRYVVDIDFRGQALSIVAQENHWLLPYTEVYLVRRGRDVPLMLEDRSEKMQFGNNQVVGLTAAEREAAGNKAWDDACTHVGEWAAGLRRRDKHESRRSSE